SGPCTNDDACALGQVCDLTRQLCVTACRFDFDENNSIGCPSTQVCNVVERYLKASTPAAYFGMGRCAKPCDEAADAGAFCAGFASADLCVAEKPSLTHGTTEKRCRPPHPPQSCVSDKECAASQPYKGYCDIPSRQCVSNACRDDNDCSSGFGCTPGSKTC